MKIDGSKNNLNNSGPIFGQPLEKSLSRDNASMKAKQSNTGSSGGSNKSGRSSRSSITSLQDSLLGRSGGGDNVIAFKKKKKHLTVKAKQCR